MAQGKGKSGGRETRGRQAASIKDFVEALESYFVVIGDLATIPRKCFIFRDILFSIYS